MASLTQHLLLGQLLSFPNLMSTLNCLPLPTFCVSFLIPKETITEPLPCVYRPMLSTGGREVSLPLALP